MRPFMVEKLLDDVYYTLELFEPLKTVMKSFNEILGCTDNSRDLKLLEKLGGVYADFQDPKREKCLYQLLDDTKKLTEDIKSSLLQIEETKHAVLELMKEDNSSNYKKSSKKVVYQKIKKLLIVTIPNTMNTMLSMRDNDFKIQTLKTVDLADLHKPLTGLILDALTKKHAKELMLTDVEKTLSVLLDKVKSISFRLRSSMKWIEIQLNKYAGISDSLFPNDIVTTLSFDTVAEDLDIEDKAALMIWEKDSQDLENYKDLISHAIDLVEVSSACLGDRNIPRPLLDFYGKGVLLLEYIIEERLWTKSRMKTTELRLMNLRTVLAPFVIAIKNFVTPTKTSRPANTEPIKKPLFSIDKQYRFFMWYYEKVVDTMSHIYYHSCERSIFKTHKKYDKGSPNWNSVMRHKAGCEAIKPLQFAYFDYGNTIRHFKLQLIKKRRVSGKMTHIVLGQEIKRLTKYLKNFSIINDFIFKTVLACQKERYIRNKTLTAFATTVGGTFISNEMLYYTSQAISFLEHHRSHYHGIIIDVRNTLMRLLIPELSTSHICKKAWLKVLKKDYNQVISGGYDLLFILEILFISENHTNQIFDFYRRLHSFDDSYDSKMWADLVKEFFSLKPAMQKAILLDHLMVRLKLLLNEYKKSIDTIDRIPGLATAIGQQL
ncbi:TATA-binding -associated factor 172-like, putative [Babesia ovis]|uniref:TATA-binding -associated factor 172-like, putative n=1 Tax=Babesia ovis TaxID=5869 RepID=A0A9W5T807_BABOV|nr:TATA-binding -associated factor 172-like, putative [Babesia ovis]